MLISSSGAPGERRPAPGRGVVRATSCRTWTHRLSVLSIALAGSMLAASGAYALSFVEAREIAEQQSPRVSAQRLQIDAVESAQKAAGTLPDPKLSIGLESFPISGMDRWSLTRESMTGQRLALMQEVPNQAKRAAKVASAQARVERERAALVLQRLQIRQELGLAWIAAQAVEQRDQLLAELLAENRRLQDSLLARVAGGSAQAGDLLTAQQEALALSDRRDDLQRDRSKARAMLRRWVGPRADESLQGGTGPLIHPVAQLRAELSSHAELALYPTMQSMARAESHEAQSEARGDWSWEVAYTRRDRRWGDMVSFQLTFDLPWQKERRQTPMIQAKQRELERLEAEQEPHRDCRARQRAGQHQPGGPGDDPAQHEHPADADRTAWPAGADHRQSRSGVAAVPADVLPAGSHSMSTTKKLRLGPLPRTESVKLTFACPVSLKADLDRYAALHAQVYGEAVDTATLIPYMLEAFMEGDRGFKRTQTKNEKATPA